MGISRTNLLALLLLATLLAGSVWFGNVDEELGLTRTELAVVAAVIVVVPIALVILVDRVSGDDS
ncbi:hypothetical protein [Natrialba swarupiae]|uniref:Uncharacterized protein n=1 Tax=Natrialba swarupiae TaxID=2448032 RepID=A0A5D5AFU7_9EURY|nr:hypothetical protein [Natrialba swarupiae]TYT60669.1 hypothetical protein FYC77_17590 [Natrialba swarupiae]